MISTDLVHWETLPIALAPSEVYDLEDEGGVFTGTAVAYHEKLTIIYCGSTFKNGVLSQVQCLADTEDGVHFTKYEQNPVLSERPAEATEDFRDPYVFQDEGKWYMVLGTCKDHCGKALLYLRMI